MWVKGVLSPERLPEPLQRATLVIRVLHLLSVLRARVAGAEVRIAGNWHSYGCQGDPCFKIDRNSFWKAEGLSTDRRRCTLNAEKSCNR